MDLVSYFPALFVTLCKKGFLSHNDWNQHAYLRHMGREYVFFLQSSRDFPLIPGDILEQSPSHHHKISSEEEVSIAQAPNFRKEDGIASSGIISLTTSSSTTNVIFIVCTPAILIALFDCFWAPLNPLRLFQIPFIKTDCFFPSFGIIYFVRNGIYELFTLHLHRKLRLCLSLL